MNSYYYHSTLTIGWRIFNHIENSSSPIHDFDEYVYIIALSQRCVTLYSRENCYGIVT